MRRGWTIWIGLWAAAACGSPAPSAPSERGEGAPRELDPGPRPIPGQPELADGEGLVGWALDTGGDQMSLGSREAGLVVWARWRDGGLAQTVASCERAGFGEPPPRDGVYEAGCDGEAVTLRLEGSRLRVEREGARSTTLRLPAGVAFRVVRPRGEARGPSTAGDAP